MLCAKIYTKRSKVAVYKFAYGTNIAYYFDNGAKVTVSKNNFFGAPLKCGLRVSSPFGRRRHPLSGHWANHTGVDFLASYGTPVCAIFDGIVTRASYYHGYGLCVDICHKLGGYTSRYAHLSGCNVIKGTKVKKGQIIGRVGSSGASTGCHLHLELARNNRALNPLSIKMIHDEPVMVPNLSLFKIYKNQINLLMAK